MSKNLKTFYDFEDGNGPVPAHKHPNGGGLVADTSNVAETAFVGPNARVSGNAWVSGNARVYGFAEVSGNAWVSGNAQVFENAKVNKGTITSGYIKETQDVYYEKEEKEKTVKKNESKTTIIMSAEEARIKSDQNTKIKLDNLIAEQMKSIHESILAACEEGKYHVKKFLKDEIIANRLFKTIETNLHQAGYKLDYDFPNKWLTIYWEYYTE